MIRKYLIFAAFILSSWFSAQHEFLKQPKLEIEDVKKLKSTSVADAPAEVLYRSMFYYIDERGFTTRKFKERVKIYDKDKASSYLDKEIYFVQNDNNSRQTLTGLKAYTHNYENGNIVSTKVEKDSKFKSKEDKNVFVTKFAYPNVKNGSVLEYEYELSSPPDFLISIPKFVIEDDIPVKYVEYVFDTPDVLGYNINSVGSLAPKHRDVSTKNLYGSMYKVNRFAYENIPAYTAEQHVLNNNNYKTAIKSELNSTFINHDFRSYAVTWDDIRKRLLDHESFGGELKRKSLVKDIYPTINIDNPSELSKAAAILKYVQTNFTWNGEKDIAIDKGIKNLINTKVGNAAEINLLLTMLLRQAGLQANPVILSTVDRGLLLSFSPSIATPNYVIAAVESQGKKHLLDATSKFSSINTIPPRALNYNGVEISDKKAEVLDIAYPEISKTFLTIDAKLNPDGTFQGKFSDKDTNLYALMVNEMYHKDKAAYVQRYKDEYKFPLNNINTISTNEEVETNLDFTSDSFVDRLGNKLVFNPLLFLFTQNHSFNQKEARRAPIELFTGYERVKKVTITLPEGFIFENVPSSKKFRTDDSSIVYSYVVTKTGDNKLTVETSTRVQDPFYPSEYYPAFTQIFDNITKLEGQVATVVKK